MYRLNDALSLKTHNCSKFPNDTSLKIPKQCRVFVEVTCTFTNDVLANALR